MIVINNSCASRVTRAAPQAAQKYISQLLTTPQLVISSLGPPCNTEAKGSCSLMYVYKYISAVGGGVWRWQTKSHSLQSGSRLQLTPEVCHWEEGKDSETAVKRIDSHQKNCEGEAKSCVSDVCADQIIGRSDSRFYFDIIDTRWSIF